MANQHGLSRGQLSKSGKVSEVAAVHLLEGIARNKGMQPMAADVKPGYSSRTTNCMQFPRVCFMPMQGATAWTRTPRCAPTCRFMEHAFQDNIQTGLKKDISVTRFLVLETQNEKWLGCIRHQSFLFVASLRLSKTLSTKSCGKRLESCNRHWKQHKDVATLASL